MASYLARLAVVAVCAATAPGAAGAETLYGSIQGGNIALRHADGSMVTQLAAGAYSFEVTDNEVIHNFHLLGTSVLTPIDESQGTFSFANVALAAGSYVYRCDVHQNVFGTFGVNQPPAPSTPPAAVVRVRAVRVQGTRVVAVSLDVERASSATAHLRRSGRLVAGARRTFAPGRRAIRLRVPARAPGGRYGVRVTLREAGKTFVVRRTVRVPAPRRAA